MQLLKENTIDWSWLAMHARQLRHPCEFLCIVKIMQSVAWWLCMVRHLKSDADEHC
jgi:hypothetical protein